MKSTADQIGGEPSIQPKISLFPYDCLEGGVEVLIPFSVLLLEVIPGVHNVGCHKLQRVCQTNTVSEHCALKRLYFIFSPKF